MQEEVAEEVEQGRYMVVEQVFVVEVMVAVVISHLVAGEVEGVEERHAVVADFIEDVDLEEHQQRTKIHIIDKIYSLVYSHF